MSSQLDAIERLFRDDDPATVALVKEQLLLRGEAAVDDLRDLVNADSAIVAAHAQEVLHTIAGKKSACTLEALCKLDSEIPLEQACWLIAASLLPWLDIEEFKETLNEWSFEVKKRLQNAPNEPLKVLTEYLNGGLGFDGNVDDYYIHENSLLPCMMESRKGLPLTLTLLYMFVGQRAGIPVHGVNLPGHFIARCGETYFDPFHSGRVLSIADCADILARQQIELSDEHLENPSSRQILARLLANLSHAYDIEDSKWQKQMVGRWLALVIGSGVE